jgi:hypothetical protein
MTRTVIIQRCLLLQKSVGKKQINKAAPNMLYLSYAQSTKVLGYGAIGGSPSGLFASDPDLLAKYQKILNWDIQ